MNKQVTLSRDNSLDKHRGFAVIIMAIFHATYDLKMFKLVDVNFHDGFWYWFPRFIAFNFLFCVGISLQKAYSRTIDWPKFWQRFRKIFGGAVLISIITFILFPTNWVYFGTLHCIALSSLLGLVFVNRPWLSISTAVTIVGFMLISGINVTSMTNMIGQTSMDFIPIYPWFAVVLLGIFYECKGAGVLSYIWKWTPAFFEYLGKKALFIYLIHQPLLYGAAYLLHKLIK